SGFKHFFVITRLSSPSDCDDFVTRRVYFRRMPADRPALSSDVAPVPRLEAVPEQEPSARPSLRLIELPGRTPAASGIADIVPTDLAAPELYLNRELTYLNFCWRVLHEAEDDRLPL